MSGGKIPLKQANEESGVIQETAMSGTRRTTTDIIFDTLLGEILSLTRLPGSRMSEAELAAQLGVSRQPVRDAFNRLANLGLLVIRPQRATVVRGFSMEEIVNARFVRLALELELITRAAEIWDGDMARKMAANLSKQQDAIAQADTERFHALDYEFHRSICIAGGTPLAFETVETCKRTVDRLCLLSLGRADEVDAILEDHQAIFHALDTGSVTRARDTTRHHLGRLDKTIADIYEKHSEYFE